MLHAEAFGTMMLNVHMPTKDKASPYLQEAAPGNAGFSMSRSSDSQISPLPDMHIFHFQMNRISFSKYLFFIWKVAAIEISLSVTMLRIKQKPIYLPGSCRSDSLLGHLFMCAACLVVQINLLLGRPASCCKFILQFQSPSPAIGPLIRI